MTTCRGLPNPHTHTHCTSNTRLRVRARTRARYTLALSVSLSLSFSPRRSTPSSPSPIERRHPSRSALHQCEASTRLGLFRFFLSLSLSLRVVNNRYFPPYLGQRSVRRIDTPSPSPSPGSSFQPLTTDGLSLGSTVVLPPPLFPPARPQLVSRSIKRVMVAATRENETTVEIVRE